ncbi:uncharacterized protein KRP23_14827 [Phytophthora ramorum]|uniref:uncharacterized protein n=2 Tax=Phytophthora ramorum TaxID=164328 RepID=UPI0030A6F458|nr:hypothetical protein KRP23_14827 [Phytophthora ramorum]
MEDVSSSDGSNSDATMNPVKATKAPKEEGPSESASGSSSIVDLFDGLSSSSLDAMLEWLFNSASGSAEEETKAPTTKTTKTTKASKKTSSESTTGSSSEALLGSSFESSLGSQSESASDSSEAPATKVTKATKGSTQTTEFASSSSEEESTKSPVATTSKGTKATKSTKTVEDSASASSESDLVHQSDVVQQESQPAPYSRSALRDVLSLRRPNVTATELEEVLRTFCALFPLELQVPDAQLISGVVGVDVKERKVFDVVHALLQDQTEQSRLSNARDMTELLLTSFRRIIRWRELYKLCAKCSLKPFLTCLYRPSPNLVLSVLETLELILSPCPGFESGDKAAERSEAANRRNFGDAGGFEVLRSLLVQYGAAVVKEEQKRSAAAVLEGVLQIFHLTLVTRRTTTDMMTVSQAVDALMNARVSLLDLCHCRDSEHEVAQLAIGLVKELFCIVDLNQVHELQESAREYGALLYALEPAVQQDTHLKTIENGTKVEESRESAIEMREMCANLVEVFCAGNTRSKKAMYPEPEDEAVSVINERDALIRAGISLLLAIVRRAKFVLRLVRPKRMFLCRLLAVETLDHVTITRLLFVLKQLALQDNNNDSRVPGGSGAVYNQLSSASSSSVASHTSSTSDCNWRSLTVVYVLLASCDPKGMGMCVAAAEFLKESCAQPPTSRTTDGSKSSPSTLSSCEFNDLLNEALGYGGCGMERLLNSVNAEVFAETFNAPEKRAADVNWGRKQRVRLYRYLKHKYLGSSEKDSSTAWSTLVNDDADHHYEDDDLFIGNIFLRSYVEGDGEFLNEWTPEMYSELINALFEKLVLLGRRKSAYAGTGSAGSLPASPLQQLSLGKSSIGSGGSCAAEPWEVQVLILKALARLVPSHCAEVKIKADFYESLLAPLRRSMLSEVDQVRGILSLDLFVAILSIPDDRNANTAACRSFLEDKGLSALADSLERMRSPAYQQILQTVEVFGPRRRSNSTTQNMARILLYRSTDVLSILANQNSAGIRAITKNPKVVTALIELASRQIITQYADIDAASVCLSCLGGLCHYEELRALVVNTGGLLSLLDTVVFCPAEELDKSAATDPQVTSDRSESDTSDAEDSQQENAEGDQTSEHSALKAVGNSIEEPQRIPSRFFGAIRSAALVLRACMGPKNVSTPTLPTQVLHQLLTPSFVRVLRASPDQFILELQTAEDISTATLIWTVSMRQRLQKCITIELGKVKTAASAKTWPRWDPEHFVAADSFRYQYPELTDVLVLHDVYLANFVATPVEDLDLGDIDMASFSEALLISIQSHENVLRILRERGSIDSAKEAAVRLMRQAMEKLVSTHPQHNLEVAASRDAPLSDSSPAMSPTTSSIFSTEVIAVSNSFSPTDDRDWDITRIERCSSSGIEDLTV